MRALLRIDFPSSMKTQTREEKRKVAGIRMVLLFFTLYGMTPLLIILVANDILLGATVSVTVSAFALAMTLLSGEATDLLSSHDFQILGYRPVSSRTYMAVRVTTLLVRSIAIATSTSILPMAGFIVRQGVPGIAIAVALFVAAQLACAAATFAIVVLYASLLERLGPERIKRAVAYANVVASSIVWLGFIVVSQNLIKRFVAGATMHPALAVLLPPAWFASIVTIAGGTLNAWLIIGALLAVASLVALGWLIRDKLAIGYTEGLTRTEAAASAKPSRPAQHVAAWMPAIRNESRAVLLIARSVIVHDMKFRLALISLLPMTAVYMFMNGMPTDPFVRTRGAGNAPIVQMIVLFLPMIVRQVIVQSEAHKASWIFHTTAARRSTLLVASRNVIVAFFLLPYLAILAAFFAYAFGTSTHALVHVGFMALLSGMMLQFDIMIRPQLPFSMAPMKDTRFGAQFFVMIVGGVVGTGFYFLLTKVAYRSVGRMVVAAAILLAVISVLEWFARRRINRRRVEDLYFD